MYKRQPLDSAFVSQVSNNLLANAVRYAQTTVTISFALHDNGLLPVSYTHLDVYKRQVHVHVGTEISLNRVDDDQSGVVLDNGCLLYTSRCV